MQGMQLREPQSIMGPRDLERLSSELVRLCDSVEKHGLVDYEMGVAEEDIMDCKFNSRDICLNDSDCDFSVTPMSFASESWTRQDRGKRPSNRIIRSRRIERTMTHFSCHKTRKWRVPTN